MRDGMVRACREGTWTAESRDCFAPAGDEAAMKACWNGLTDAQRAELARLAAGTASNSGAGSAAPPPSDPAPPARPAPPHRRTR